MLRLSIGPRETVPDFFRYTFPDGTFIIQAFYGDWLDKIKKHYVDNGIPMPDDWIARAEDQLCRILPPGFCKQTDGGSLMNHIDTRINASQIYHGAVTLLNVVREREDALVDPALANQRAVICSSCPANINVEGCLPCLKISDLIMGVTGPKRETPSDQFLKSCACCGCPARAAVHVKIEILSKAMTQGMRDKFALAGEWCWQEKERAALEQATA